MHFAQRILQNLVNTMKTIQNKYKQWHDNIIARGKNRILTGYKEKHHIIPKSLGGNNSKDNLVELTAREHFMVHMLLCKFTTGQAKMKMSYAFNAMSTMRYGKRKYKLHSRTAGVLRKEFYQSLKGRKDSPETRLKKSLRFQGKNNPNYGKKFSKEHRRKLSEAKKGKKHILIGKKHKPETIEKMKQKKLGKKYSDVSRLKMSISQRKYKTKIRIQKYLNLFTYLDTMQNSNEIKGNL